MNSVALDPIWVDAAQEAAKAFSYGDVIQHSWLLSALGLNPPAHGTADQFRKYSFDLLQRVEGFKKTMLEDHQMYLSNVKGEGYRIVHLSHQTGHAMRTLQRELRKSVSRAAEALTHINTQLMQLDDFKENAESRAKLAWLSQQSTKRLASK